jgi:hypothetical protein
VVVDHRGPRTDARSSLREDSAATEHSNQDLAELLAGVPDDARDLAGRYDLTIEWNVDGDRPHGTVADAVAAARVVLLTRVIN